MKKRFSGNKTKTERTVMRSAYKLININPVIQKCYLRETTS